MFLEIADNEIKIIHIKNTHYNGKIIKCDIVADDYNTGEMVLNINDTVQITQALVPYITKTIKSKVLKILDKYCEKINKDPKEHHWIIALETINEIRKEIEKE